MDHLHIRTEASAEIGFGHAMRCLAIAEAARARDIGVTFLMAALHPALALRLAGIGAEWRPTDAAIGTQEDAAALDDLVPRGAALLVDSYAVDVAYLAALHTRFLLVLMDDLAQLPALPCSVLVNASAGAPALPYEALAPGAVKLLGAGYAPIRREFAEPATPVVPGPSVAVMFGGSDVRHYTPAVCRSLLAALPDRIVKAIVGPAAKGREVLETLAGVEPRLRLFVNPPRVADVLAGSGLVVTAAGGSVGEIAAMGLMALVVVVADNQVSAFESCPYPVLDGRRVLPPDLGALAAGYVADAARSGTLAARAQALVDGRGSARIIERLCTLV